MLVGNNDKHEIYWTFSGNEILDVSIDNARVAHITVTEENWSGVETITFQAIDPNGNQDTASVEFIVKSVNDPPVVMDIPDQTIYDYSRFEPIMMDNYVVDTDNADHEISWTTMGQRNLTVSIKDRVAFISLADKHWIGYETIMFTATDPSGLQGSKMAMFTVEDSGFCYDLNNNGIIDLADMLMMLQFFTGIDIQVMSDKQIGFDDLLLILNRISR